VLERLPLWARKLLTPPVYRDNIRTASAANKYLLAWSLLLIISPMLVVLALLVPPISSLVWVALVGIDVLSIITILMTRRGWLSQATFVFIAGLSALFMWIAWASGGIFSASICAPFLIVVLAEMTQGWRWALPAALLSAASFAVLMWGNVTGAVPPSPLLHMPLAYGSVVLAYLFALALIQAVIAARARRSSGRILTELEQRKTAERRLLDLIDNAPFGAFLCELHNGRRLVVEHANLVASVVLGTDADHFVGGELDEVFATSDDRGLMERFRTVATSGEPFSGETQLYSAGVKRVLEVHAYRSEARVIAVFISDITQRRLAEAEIQHAAFHDELTKLPNRKLLLDRLAVAIAASRRRESGIALLFIDLDEFKPINDRFGHGFGDLLLTAVAERLGSIARASDTVARIGGDEFTVLMPDVASREHVETVAKKFVAAFQEPFEVEGRSVQMTASIGVSISTDQEVGPNELVEHADLAMYEMKRAGRNGYRVR
jgi:diguanylate cyclase (GGDEF)-like protein